MMISVDIRMRKGIGDRLGEAPHVPQNEITETVPHRSVRLLREIKIGMSMETRSMVMLVVIRSKDGGGIILLGRRHERVLNGMERR